MRRRKTTEVNMELKLTPQQIIRRKAAGQPVGPEEVEANKLRVINMFSARGFNLESVVVGETSDKSISRMTIVTTGDNRIIKQVNRQLDRLIDVLEVDDVTETDHVERELCLLRAHYTPETRSEILDTLQIFRGKVVDITRDTMTYELTGPSAKIDAFVELIRPHGIIEVARSGRIALRRSVDAERRAPHQDN